MAFVSITRLRLRGYRFLLPFAWQARLGAKQAGCSPGFLAGAIFGDVKRTTFWTATVWENEAAMRAFRAAGDHQRIMPRLADWCDEAAVAHWEQPGTDVPSPEEMLDRMRSSGRTSRLRHPTPDHAAGKTVSDGRAPAGIAPIRPARRSG